MIKKPDLDPDNMFGAIYNFPDNIQQAINIGNEINLKRNYNTIQNVIVAGMGGSAIGGDVVRSLVENELEIPFIVSRQYTLPNWVNEHTLVICSSYSGNTEETLAAFEEAQFKGAQICGIATGGELTRCLASAGLDSVEITSGLQPRAALAFSAIPMLYLLQKAGLISDAFQSSLVGAATKLFQKRKIYSKESTENPTFSLAQRIYKKIPIIYGSSDSTSVIAMRWKGQICENAKMLAFYNELPEMNHNEIVGWENNAELFRHLVPIWLKDKSDYRRVTFRQRITQSILINVTNNQETVFVDGDDRIERFLHLIYFGDWVSYWCALAHETDPSPVDKINRLKVELKKL